jgi:hypothetical protein
MHPGRVCRLSKGDNKGLFRVITNNHGEVGMRQKQTEEILLFLFPGVFKICGADLW